MISNCPFCLDEKDQMYFMRDELFTAIYNKSPILPGHSLIIPNRHVERFDDLTDQEISNLLSFTKNVKNRLDVLFPNNGFDWTLQDGKSAGQTVLHFHIHLIPRNDKDLSDPGDWYPQLEKSSNPYLDSHVRPKLSDHQLLEINKKLREIDL